MNSRSLLFIAIGLISIILTSSFIIYELGFIRSSVPSGAAPSTKPQPTPTPAPTLITTPGTSSGALWQRPIENFATTLAVDDGKVFTTDNSGNINCFDSQNGKSIWNGSIGGFPSYGLEISGSQVYVGFQERQVGCLDENTGKLLWTFQNEQAPNRLFKGSPEIIVKDGRVFAITDTVSAHNATTGELLWEAVATWSGNSNSTWSMSAFPLKGDPFDGNYVYETGGYYSSMHFYKLNMDNGQVLWSSSVTWDATVLTFGLDYSIYAPQVLTTIQGQVIIEKAENILSTLPTVNQIFSLDANTGQKLWGMNVAANIYNPTVYNNLLLFSASDGYFYALNLADGTIAWKTKVDTQNLFSFANSTMYLLSPNFQIDSKDQRLLWSFAVKQGDSPGNYTATLCNLNLANGNMIWTKQIEEKWADAPRAGLAFNNDRIFLTGNRALWIFNASTGDFVQSQQFDHYVLEPIVLDNKTFVVGDLKLAAYV